MKGRRYVSRPSWIPMVQVTDELIGEDYVVRRHRQTIPLRTWVDWWTEPWS